jgi:dipeptidyl aminopeptidase/acylaminoacyl peptidase
MNSQPVSPAFTEVESWVRDHLARCQEPGEPAIADISQVAPRPGGDVVACTLLLREGALAPEHRRVAVVDLTGDRLTILELPYAECTGPEWSPDGSRLALVGSSPESAAALVLQGEPHSLEVSATSELPGFVESVHWSADGSLLALQVAMPGAEISDVFGSGTLGGGDAETWRPRVLPSEGTGRRLAYVWEPGSGESRLVSDRNVWELAWCGDRALLAVTTDHPEEDAWYGAVLERLPLDGSAPNTLFVPDDQVSVPRATPSGSRWSVLSGLQSDRGLPAGLLVSGVVGGPWSVVETHDVHVTDHSWLDETTLLVAGLRGLETVVATVDVGTGVMAEVWSGPETCGEFFPQVSALPGRDPLVVLESRRDPPRLGVLAASGFREVLPTAGPGTTYQAARAGTTTLISWESSDGMRVEGLLTLPQGDEQRRPLVLLVHGGPTHACRNTWIGRDPQASSLVARGYAVLQANPRGSTGRGSAFADAVRGDMGGLDADDLVSGVRRLVDLGVADPARLGVTGISYGGFMSSWLPARTDLFAAAVARSPCTDWLLQHLTSNIAEFDRRFLQGEPFDPHSQYAGRSPLRHVDSIRTPMLLTAGLDDLATPPSQAQVLHTALRERGVPTQLVLYPEEGHGVRHPLAIVDQCARMIAWFDRHLSEVREEES